MSTMIAEQSSMYATRVETWSTQRMRSVLYAMLHHLVDMEAGRAEFERLVDLAAKAES